MHGFAAVIEIISRFVCLQEGDVISLEPGQALADGTELTATIDGIGSMTLAVLDRRCDDNYYSRSMKGGEAGAFV